MNIVKAGVIYFGLMFSTAIGWFLVWASFRDPIQAMADAVNISEATTAIQNIVTGANIAFFAAMILWTVWFAYAAHSREQETTYAPGLVPSNYRGFKRW